MQRLFNSSCIKQFFTSVILFLAVCGLALYFPNKYVGHGFVVVAALLGLAQLLIATRQHFIKWSWGIVWPAALLVMLLSLLVGYFVHGGDKDWRRLNEFIEIAAIGFVLFLVFSQFSSEEVRVKKLMPWVLALGAGITGLLLISTWSKYGFNGRMWQGTSMINISAGTQIILVGSLMGFLVASKFHWSRLFWVVAIALGSVSIFASGSRGAWLALLTCFCLAGLFLFSKTGWKVIVTTSLVAVLSFYALLQTNQVQQRIEHGKNDIAKYIDGGQRKTSLGLRFEMWRSAWDGFVAHPFTGMGAAPLGQRWQGIDHDYHLVPLSPHVHNDFLEAAQSRGLLGLTSVLLLLIAPVYLGWRYRESQYGKALFVATGGFIVACLFDSHLVMKFALFYYVTMQSVLLGLLISDVSKSTPAVQTAE